MTTLAPPAPLTVVCLARLVGGRPSYLSRTAMLGNLMATSEPLGAFWWHSEHELALWRSGLLADAAERDKVRQAAADAAAKGKGPAKPVESLREFHAADLARYVVAPLIVTPPHLAPVPEDVARC